MPGRRIADRAHVRARRRRRAVLPRLAPADARRPARSCSSTAATSIPAAGRRRSTRRSATPATTAVFAWDQRGHGRSPGERGSAENLAVVVKDADASPATSAATHGMPLEDMVVVAHSVGAVVAAAWVHDYAPPIRGLVLATPAFRVKLYVPFAVPRCA